MQRLTSIIIFALFLLMGQDATAAVIAAWDVAGLDVAADLVAPSYGFDAGTLDANATSAQLTLGSVNPSTSPDQYGFKISGADTQTTLAGAITEDHYLQISLTVANGFQLNLDNLEFFGDTTGTGADDVAVFTSVDGFTAGNEIASLTGRQAVATGALDTDVSGFGGPIDLTAAAYQGLTGTVSFRIYGFNTGSGSGVTFIRNLTGNDLVINGDLVTAVPEPSSIALLAGWLAVVTVRRRKK